MVFAKSGSYIEKEWSKDRIWLREDNGVYVLDMMVAPPETTHESAFGRQGRRESRKCHGP